MNHTDSEDKELKLEIVPEEEEGEQDRPASALLAQFVLLPLLIVFVCVGVFFTFSWLTGEGKTATDYLNELRYSTGDRRWQAAFELSKFVNYSKDPSIARAMLPDMITVFRNVRRGESYDPRIRQYLALAIGRIGDPQAVPALLEGLNDPDPNTQLYCVWALGLARDSSATAPLIQTAQRGDPALRKMAVYALGNYPGEEVRGALKAALGDASPDVRWNAALGLARQGDASGKEVILQILDREYLNRFDRLSKQEKADIMINALRGVKILKDPSFEPTVRMISNTDPHPSVRQAAIEVLKTLEP